MARPDNDAARHRGSGPHRALVAGLAAAGLLLLTSCATAPSPDRPQPEPCAYREIPLLESDAGSGAAGLSSTQGRALEALGEPDSVLEGPWFCITSGGGRRDGSFLRLRYEGLVVHLVREEGDETFSVRSFELSSPDFHLLPGIRVGETEEAVRESLGEARTISTNGNTGNPVWKYRLSSCGDGLHLEMKDGVLVEVRASTWCL